MLPKCCPDTAGIGDRMCPKYATYERRDFLLNKEITIAFKHFIKAPKSKTGA
jgi:hypothetical protein